MDSTHADERAYLVLQSFERAVKKGLSPRFYELLLARDERIAVMFRHTNFERQHGLLEHGVYMLVMFSQGRPVAGMAIERLASMHSREGMNVRPELYGHWVECLIQTLMELDEQFSDELEEQWRAVLAPGLARIIAAYE